METIRVAFSLSPDETLWREVVNASQDISDEFRNMNEIDDKQYPPHLSLHICTIPFDAVEAVKAQLAEIWSQQSPVALNVEKIVAGSGGYVSVEIEHSEELSTLHKAVIECAAETRKPLRANADAATESNIDRYGNDYVLDKFHPHFSIAKVDFEDQPDALSIAKSVIKSNAAKATALQLVDIAPDNSKWQVLWSS